MAAVSMLVDPSVRCTVIGKEHQAGMISLRRTCQKIEGRVIVQEKISWIARLRSDDIWALDRIPAKEDGLLQVSVCWAKFVGRD